MYNDDLAHKQPPCNDAHLMQAFSGVENTNHTDVKSDSNFKLPATGTDASQSDNPLAGLELEDLLTAPEEERHRALAKRISDIYTQRQTSVKEAIGEILFRVELQGDLNALSSHAPGKESSIKKLLDKLGLPYKPLAIWRMVRVACLNQWYLDRRLDPAKLSYGHKLEILPLKDEAKRLKLYDQITGPPSLTTAETRSMVRASNGTKVRTGAPKVDKQNSTFERLGTLLRKLTELLTPDIQDALNGITEEGRKDLQAKIDEAVRLLSLISDKPGCPAGDEEAPSSFSAPKELTSPGNMETTKEGDSRIAA